jgi:hypothetical protein
MGCNFNFTKSAFAGGTEQRDIEVFLYRPPAFEKVLLAERKQGRVLGESGYRNDHISTFKMIS